MSNSPLSSKSVKLMIILALVLFVFVPIVRPFEVALAQSPDQSQNYTREFSWDYGGNHWIWNLSIPVALYNAYKAVPDSVRTQNGPAGYDLMVTTKDSYMQTLTEKLNETANQLGYGPVDKINFVLAFVQSIPYSTDLNSTGYEEYPRFPIEVLVDQTGDCDCKSDLFVTLTLGLGYGAVFINPPDHLAVGVLGDNLQGTFWTYQNQTYYYAETTGVGFKLGDLPDEFKGKSAFIYPIDENKQFVVNSQTGYTIAPNPSISPYTSSTPTSAPTQNSGTAPTGSPDITQPIVQPVQPISLNLISDYPVLFIVIVTAIVFSIVITVKTATNKQPKSKQIASSEPSISPTENQNISEGKLVDNTEPKNDATKFCIYCGSSNKSFALYCEKCGKKIA
ncbi:MAG: hypothetical protein ABSA79_01695 [Candidatus Bathyarchaeia archaeon]